MQIVGTVRVQVFYVRTRERTITGARKGGSGPILNNPSTAQVCLKNILHRKVTSCISLPTPPSSSSSSSTLPHPPSLTSPHKCTHTRSHQRSRFPSPAQLQCALARRYRGVEEGPTPCHFPPSGSPNKPNPCCVQILVKDGSHFHFSGSYAYTHTLTHRDTHLLLIPVIALCLLSKKAGVTGGNKWSAAWHFQRCAASTAVGVCVCETWVQKDISACQYIYNSGCMCVYAVCEIMHLGASVASL